MPEERALGIHSMRVAFSHSRTTLVWRKILAPFSHDSPWSRTWEIHTSQRFFFMFSGHFNLKGDSEESFTQNQ